MRSRTLRPLAPRKRRTTTHAPRIEALEARQLMASQIIETPLNSGVPTAETTLVTRASDLQVWAVSHVNSTNTDTVLRVDSQGATTPVLTLPASEFAHELIAGKDGAVWVLAGGSATSTSRPVSSHLYKLTKDYSVSIPLPEPTDSATVDTAGNVWTVGTPGADPSGSMIREYNGKTALPVASAAALRPGVTFAAITAADDGALWFEKVGYALVARVGADGAYSEVALDLRNSSGGAPDLAAGSGGRIWAAGSGGSGTNVVVSITSAGATTPVGLGLSFPWVIASGPDGSVWFGDVTSSRVGRVSASGDVFSAPLPRLASGFYDPIWAPVTSIAPDLGSGAFFAQAGAATISHVITDAPEPGVAVHARSITAPTGPLAATTTLASFTTTDASAFAFDYVARYEIDGQRPHDGVILSDGNGGYVVQAGDTADPQFAGNHLLTVTVMDVRHGYAVGTTSTSIAVAGFDAGSISVQGSTIAAVPGVLFDGKVATLVNTGSPVTTYVSVDWGDGTTPMPGSNRESGDILDRHTYAFPGTYTVTVTATHGGVTTTGTSTAVVTIPAITSLTPVTGGYSQGHSGRARVATFETDSPSNPGDYSPTVTMPDGTRMATEIVPVGPTSFEIWASGVFQTFGEIPLTVRVGLFTGGPAVAGGTASAIVTPAPITASPTAFGVHATVPFSADVANFSAGFNNWHLNYSATIDWGDGTTSTGRVVANPNYDPSNSGVPQFSVWADHTYADAGNRKATVTIRAVDYPGMTGGTIVARVTSDAVVDAAFRYATGDTITAVVDRAWVGYVASFGTQATNLPASSVSATIHWGDGSPDSQGQVTPDGLGNYSVSSGHYFARSGAYDATVTFRLADGTTATAQTKFQAELPPFVATGTSLSGTQGATISGVLATILDSSRGMPSDYVATIDWGDGTTSSGQISTYQDQLVVFGQHTYATPGAYAYGVTMLKSGHTEVPITAGGTIAVAASDPAGTPGSGGQVGGGGTTSPLTILARPIGPQQGAVRVTVSLGGTIDASQAGNPATFALIDPGKDGKIGTKDDKGVRVASAKYDAGSHTVTLTPKGTFRRAPRFRVAMRGAASVMAVV